MAQTAHGYFPEFIGVRKVLLKCLRIWYAAVYLLWLVLEVSLVITFKIRGLWYSRGRPSVGNVGTLTQLVIIVLVKYIVTYLIYCVCVAWS